MTWAIVPTESRPAGFGFLKEQYPVNTWDIYPLAEYVAHDKAAFIHHDLGQFVTNRETLSWSLGLGYCMSYRIWAPDLAKDAPREWLRWLDRVQKSVCARYLGAPLAGFAHERGPNPTPADDGLLRATYGSVRVAANLGPVARTVAGWTLAPHGFIATAPGMVAGNLARAGGLDCRPEGVSFVTEGDARSVDVWVYAPGGETVAIELPARITRPVTLRFDGGARAQAQAVNGAVRLTLPTNSGGATKRLWHIHLQ